jgi:hypothetical protein
MDSHCGDMAIKSATLYVYIFPHIPIDIDYIFLLDGIALGASSNWMVRLSQAPCSVQI